MLGKLFAGKNEVSSRARAGAAHAHRMPFSKISAQGLQKISLERMAVKWLRISPDKISAQNLPFKIAFTSMKRNLSAEVFGKIHKKDSPL